MAPPTLPTEAKKRRGTFRADRTPGELVPIERAEAETTPPPDSLKEHGKAEWSHALSVCSWIGHSDLAALRMLCEAIDRREGFAKEIASQDLMLQTSTGYWYANPAIAALEKTEERISKWMQQLGMTPSARATLGVAEVKTASTLDKLQRQRSARKGGRPDTGPPSPPTQ